jgi:hypothetical protein
MSTVIIQPGDLVVKFTDEQLVYQWDWSTNNLAAGVHITESDWIVKAIKPIGDTALTTDQPSLLSGNRSTQIRVSGGTDGALYELTNRIITDENPNQTKDRSIRIRIRTRSTGVE